MANDNTNIQIYGGDLDVVAYAPVATVAPVGLLALPGAAKEVGWLGEDGIDWDDEPDEQEFTAHQGGVTVVHVISKIDRTFKFRCLEESAITMGLRYPGFTPAAVSGQTGVFGGQVPSPSVTPRQWYVDLHSINNAGIRKRMVVPKGVVSGAGTIVAKRSDLSILEFTVKVLEGTFFTYSNSPGWDPA